MRKYIEYIKTSFIINLAYRFNAFFQFFTNVLALFINIAIWKALYINNNVSTDHGNISLHEMITYSIISTILSVLIINNVIEVIELKIMKGNISLDLLKPVNFKLMIFSQIIGTNVSKFVIQSLPILLIGIFMYKLSVPDLRYFLLFIAATINAFILYFLITYIVSLFAFWYIKIWHFAMAVESLMRIFSGIWIPLWFFPKTFESFTTTFLPFHLVFYSPLTIYLQKISISETTIVIGKQVMWIVILTVIEQLLWKKCCKKLVVQGG